MDYKKKFEELNKQIENKKLEHARLQERQKNLQEEKTNLFAQLKELGITSEEQLKKEIETLDTEIKEGIEKCQKLLI